MYFKQSYSIFNCNFFTYYKCPAFNCLWPNTVFTHTLADVLNASDFSLLLKKTYLNAVHVQLFETMRLRDFVETCQFPISTDPVSRNLAKD